MQSINQYDDMADYYNHLMLGGYYNYKAQAQTLAQILPANASILEIGVGTGLMAKELLDLGFKVTGMDHTQTMLDKAKILLGDSVPLYQADVTDFNLNQTFDIILSNGGVWYGVWYDENTLGYCGHLPNIQQVEKSIDCVVNHLNPQGQLVLSMQDAHKNKKLDLPDNITYTQHIHPKENGAFEKEYIFTTQENQQVCYQKLTLAYIENHSFEGFLTKHGFSSPVISEDKRYITFKRD